MSTQTIGRRNEADWASIVVGLGLGLTFAMFVETTTRDDWNSVYAVVTSISRIAALIVAGRDGAKWFSRSELAKYSAWVIDRHEEVAWSVGLGHG